MPANGIKGGTRRAEKMEDRASIRVKDARYTERKQLGHGITSGYPTHYGCRE